MKRAIILFIFMFGVFITYAADRTIEFSLSSHSLEETFDSSAEQKRYLKQAIIGTVFLPISIVCIGGGGSILGLTLSYKLMDYFAYTLGSISGILLSVGVIFFVLSFPFLVVGWKNYLKCKEYSQRAYVTSEISFVPEEKNSTCGSSLSPWENNRLSLALKVRF